MTELQILKKYYPDGGSKEVQKYLNKSKDAIKTLAWRNNIKRTKGFRFSKINFSDLINPNSAEAAYILGILWADGHVEIKKKTKSIYITLKILKTDFRDIKNLFYKFNQHLVKNHKGEKRFTRARIGHKVLGNFLIRNDYLIKSKTTPTKILSKIPKKFHGHFYRAWFDGDGYCNELAKNRFVISVSGTYNQNWSEFKKLCKRLSIPPSISKTSNKIGKGSSIVITGFNRIMRFRNFIHKIDDRIGFKRKRSNFFKIKLSKKATHVAD